jgi:hypothetical protein
VVMKGQRVSQKDSLALLLRVNQTGLDRVTDPRKDVADYVCHFCCSSGIRVVGRRISSPYSVA